MGRLILIVILGMYSITSNAFETTIKLGETFWKPMQKGLYVHEDYDHQLDYKSPFMAVGVKGQVSKHFGFSGEWFNLGEYSTHSDVTSREQLWIHGGAAAAGPADAHSSTYGHAVGMSIKANANLGPLTVSAGPAVMFYKFNIQIYSKLTNTLNVDYTEHMIDKGYTVSGDLNLTKNISIGAAMFNSNASYKGVYPRGTGQVFTGYIGYSY